MTARKDDAFKHRTMDALGRGVRRDEGRLPGGIGRLFGRPSSLEEVVVPTKAQRLRLRRKVAPVKVQHPKKPSLWRAVREVHDGVMESVEGTPLIGTTGTVGDHGPLPRLSKRQAKLQAYPSRRHRERRRAHGRQTA